MEKKKKNGIELDGRVLGMKPQKLGEGMMEQKMNIWL